MAFRPTGDPPVIRRVPPTRAGFRFVLLLVLVREFFEGAASSESYSRPIKNGVLRGSENAMIDKISTPVSISFF